eukprot:6880083-Prymnesium_polylepis.1
MALPAHRHAFKWISNERRPRSPSSSPLPSTKLASFVLRCVTRPDWPVSYAIVLTRNVCFCSRIYACGLDLPRGTLLQERRMPADSAPPPG